MLIGFQYQEELGTLARMALLRTGNVAPTRRAEALRLEALVLEQEIEIVHIDMAKEELTA